MAELNETIHQPVRLRVMAALVALEPGNEVDFTYLRDLLDVTDGNLGAHLRKLEEAGYKVTAVLDADSALEKIKKDAFDLIVTDIRMPGKDGIDLITQVMALRKDVPIIINTAYQSYKHDFMTWAADAYVVKSSSLAELKAKGVALIQSGDYTGGRYAYVDATAQMGIILELLENFPEK